MANLSSRYATALFELAKESGELEVFCSQAQYLSANLESSGALGVLVHPLIPTSEKQDFVKNALASHFHSQIVGLINLAVDKNREAFLLRTFQKLESMIRKHQGYTTAIVVSATQLSEAKLARIAEVLERKLGKQVEIELRVDPQQISGISIHVDGYFLDRTVKTILGNMKKTFSAI